MISCVCVCEGARQRHSVCVCVYVWSEVGPGFAFQHMNFGIGVAWHLFTCARRCFGLGEAEIVGASWQGGPPGSSCRRWSGSSLAVADECRAAVVVPRLAKGRQRALHPAAPANLKPRRHPARAAPSLCAPPPAAPLSNRQGDAEKKPLAAEYVANQKALDAALLPALSADLKGYLGSRFTLRDGDRPHLLKF